MGVKTTVFGPHMWLLFEAVGKEIDKIIQTSKQDRKEVVHLAKEFFRLIGFVLPCIYCRNSFQKITNPARPKNKGTDIERMLTLENGGKKLVYNLRNQVSTKLRNQEMASVDSDDDKEQIKQKWDRYMISYDDAINNRFKGADCPQFWYSLVVSLALIMCDFRGPDMNYIYRFFLVLGKILMMVTNGRVHVLATNYLLAIQETKQFWSPTMTFDERLGIVWTVKKSIYSLTPWKFDKTLNDFKTTCKKAVVGCVNR